MNFVTNTVLRERKHRSFPALLELLCPANIGTRTSKQTQGPFVEASDLTQYYYNLLISFPNLTRDAHPLTFLNQVRCS